MPTIELVDDLPPSWLVVCTTRDGTLVYEAGWRHRDADGRAAHDEAPARLAPGSNGRPTGASCGAAAASDPAFSTSPGRSLRRTALVRRSSASSSERAAAAERAANAPPTFREVAHAYLDWLEHVRGAKPATLREHRYLLAEPGTPHRRGAGACRGLIMETLR